MLDFKFADIGEGIHEGSIQKWFFEVGDQVKEGETLCIVETDKVNAEIPSPVDGILKKRGAEAGEEIHVGETLALIDDGSSAEVEAKAEKEIKAQDTEKEASSESKTEAVSEDEEKAAGVIGEIEVSSNLIAAGGENEDDEETEHRALATPVARHMAKEFGLDINQIKGTGEHGRILKEDIAKASESKKEAPKETSAQTGSVPAYKDDGKGRRERISKLRETIAKNMTTSKQLIPHATTMDEFDVSKLAAFRKQQKDLAATQDVKLTFMPFFIKALALTIKEYPVFNASFDHDKLEIVYKDDINIGIAVDTPDGLIVPNIKKADQKSVFEIAKEIQVLAKKAQERTIQLPDLQGGTISITNYGAFGASFGVPVIKHPEVAIMGIGMVTKKPIVKDDEITIGEMLPISFVVDHRMIDGGDAGRFLTKFKAYLQDPMLLLLS